MKFLIHVFTCRRPALCEELIADLRHEDNALHDITLHVHCHGSTAGYDHVAERADEWVVHEPRKRFEDIVDFALNRSRTTGADFVLFLPDDVRTCRYFLDRVLSMWWAAEACGRPAGLNLLCETKRDMAPNWTGVKPMRCGAVTLTGWVDGAFATRPAVLKKLGWRLPGHGTRAWARFSRELHRAGWALYRVHESLLCHVHTPSQMHVQERRANPGFTARFVDGPAARRGLSIREPVFIGMATTAERKSCADRAVDSLAAQGQIQLHVNREGTDYGDAGKFRALAQAAQGRPGYHLTADDDLIYPDDYVERIVQKIQLYGRQAAVSWHGARIPEHGRMGNYFKQRRQVGHCLRALRRDAFAHVLGTGVLGFHASALEWGLEDFGNGYMADVWFAAVCNRQRVPRLVAAHGEGELTLLEVPGETLYQRYKNNDSEHVRVIQQAAPWPLLSC